MKRKKCTKEGCKRLCRNKGFYRGERRYDVVCDYHHRLKYGGNDFTKKMDIDNSCCSNCGWGEAPCDRHRLDPKEGYTVDNVVVLCPNCHRLKHFGKL